MARTNRPKKVPLDIVTDAMRTIHDKHDSKQFMKEASDAGVLVTVHPKTLEFMKKYIDENNLGRFAALKKIKDCPTPNDCPE
jgi:hypothetical protein